MTWVNRPTQEMSVEDSKQNQLADLYGSTLEGQEKKDFDQQIANHRQNAKDGGPKIEKDKFKTNADQEAKSNFAHLEKLQNDPNYKKEVGMAEAKKIVDKISIGNSSLAENRAKTNNDLRSSSIGINR
jgi:hypothetical protein